MQSSGHPSRRGPTVNKLIPIDELCSSSIGYVTHGTDRALWAFRDLTAPQVAVARAWLDAIDQATQELDFQHPDRRDWKKILALQTDREIEWTTDENWEDATKMRKLFPGEL